MIAQEFQEFLEFCAAEGFDAQRIRTITLEAIGHLKKSKTQRKQSETLRALEGEWYASLEQGAPAYSIYEREEYLAEAWACYQIYSRKYLRSLCSSVLPEQVRAIVDLGCGIGITCRILCDLFPSATVIGTNVKESQQWRIAQRYSNGRFALSESLPACDADIVFASEYFEHFEDPCEHLESVIASLHPKSFIIANAFTARSIGHFIQYRANGQSVGSQNIGKVFSETLKRHGYIQAKTGLWNNRPQYWSKINWKEISGGLFL